jgi:hypothetical protein
MTEVPEKSRGVMKRRGMRGVPAVVTVVAALCFGMAEYGSGQDFSSAKAVTELAAALRINPTEAAQELASGESLMGVVGPSGGGKSTLLSRSGFRPGDSVELTNAGGGRMKIARQGANNPLSIYIKMDDFY